MSKIAFFFVVSLTITVLQANTVEAEGGDPNMPPPTAAPGGPPPTGG